MRLDDTGAHCSILHTCWIIHDSVFIEVSRVKYARYELVCYSDSISSYPHRIESRKKWRNGEKLAISFDTSNLGNCWNIHQVREEDIFSVSFNLRSAWKMCGVWKAENMATFSTKFCFTTVCIPIFNRIEINWFYLRL